MKYMFIVFITCSALAFGVLYGYKLASKDNAALIRYVEVGNSFIHLKLLEEKGVEDLRLFLINDIQVVLSMHRYHLKEQSFLSGFYGPKNEDSSMTNRREYYLALKKYFETQPGIKENEAALKDLKWLLSVTE